VPDTQCVGCQAPFSDVTSISYYEEMPHNLIRIYFPTHFHATISQNVSYPCCQNKERIDYDTQFKGDLVVREYVLEFVAVEISFGMKYVFANKTIFEMIM
jgi:hypothetical protein